MLDLVTEKLIVQVGVIKCFYTFLCLIFLRLEMIRQINQSKQSFVLSWLNEKYIHDPICYNEDVTEH